jgi:penicillin-binding protein 2
MFADDELVKAHKRRADAIRNLVLVSFSIIISRLWYLQIYKGDVLYKFSVENRLRKEVVKSPRGMVFSRNNQMLIHNVPRFDAVIIPQYLKNRKESIKKLSEILEISQEQIKTTLTKNSRQARYRPVVIKKNISRKEVAIIETENSKMPGVRVRTFISREYVDEKIGSHLLGYLSEISSKDLQHFRKRDDFNYKLGDLIGKSGLEYQYDLELRGNDGHEFMEVDAQGRVKRHLRTDNVFHGIENKEAIPGYNIRLTIDRDLQISAYESLEGKVGSAVAIDVNTGEVLAMVSRPSYNPSNFSRGLTSKYWNSLRDNEHNPLRDRSIQEHYPPGSTFKTFTAIAALEEGIVDEKTEVNCNGKFRLGRRTFHCWKKYGHGKVDIYRALKESCDVYFYKIATKLDIDILARYSKLFGFNNKTGIKLPREISGLIPTKEWKLKRNGTPWQLGETLSCVIGQSYVLATPIQLAVSYAAIANGGTILRPYLIKEIFSNSGEIKSQSKPEKLRTIDISKVTLNMVKKGLYQVVNERKGTAWWYRGRGIQMSGKTGTSQVIRLSGEKLFSKCELNDYDQRNHGLFVAYAPTDKPKIAVAVVVEHGCHGSSAAAPVARAVISTYMQKYFPDLKKKYAEREKQQQIRLMKQNKAKEKELENKVKKKNLDAGETENLDKKKT